MDIDLDFETERRHEVIEYLIEKYKGHAARIASYGLYRVDNCLNDLFKVCGLTLCKKGDELKEYKDRDTKKIMKEIKLAVKKYIDDDTGLFDYAKARTDREIRYYDRNYDNIIKHFSKLYGKVRFFGTHAAGVAISGANIKDYTAIERRSEGVYCTSYDLNDIEKINAIKFDMLGLRTMSILHDLRVATNTDNFDYAWIKDKKLFEQFRLGNTDGIFQFESKSGQSILQDIRTDCMNDVIAASSLNRPGPLQMGMVQEYADNKADVKKAKQSIWYEYAKESYGTFVYQEQVMRLCVGLAGMEWTDADKMMKIIKNTKTLKLLKQDSHSDLYVLQDKFLSGCKKKGVPRDVALKMFESMLVYAFNKGHATGYAIISLEQMYYKVYYNTEFWFITLKYANTLDMARLSCKAVRDGSVLLYPRVKDCNALHSLGYIDGEPVIREGLSMIKNVGLLAAKAIEEERTKNGAYKSLKDFKERMIPFKRTVNARAMKALEEAGSLVFNDDIYFERVQQYNSTLYGKFRT